MVVEGVLPELLVNVPPAAPSDQTAAVAPPPNEPPKGVVVPPWQIAVSAPPTLTVGLEFTTICLVAITVPQYPPLVVKVSVIGETEFAAAVNADVPGVLPVLFENVPLDADQKAAVAPPPNEPPRAAEVPP